VTRITIPARSRGLRTGYQKLRREQAAQRSGGVEVGSRGVDAEGDRDQGWIADPDGNQIELMEYGPSSLQLTG